MQDPDSIHLDDNETAGINGVRPGTLRRFENPKLSFFKTLIFHTVLMQIIDIWVKKEIS